MKRKIHFIYVGVLLAALCMSPNTRGQSGTDDAVEARITELLSQMTLAEKIGQMTQVDKIFLNSDEDITKYSLGSLLSGGGNGPKDNTVKGWADMYDGFQQYALQTRLKIPLMYGVDAVHGHNNVFGTTIFPHNIGLGCMGNPELVKQAAQITALEVAATGIDWTFSPCVAVPLDERWGRTYEGFGESPELVRLLAEAAVSGYQSNLPGTVTRIAACAKHFLGDGGTELGDDQGNTVCDEAVLRAIHLQGYLGALKAGVKTVMASFSRWNGAKMHSNKYLMTDLLKGELGFKGFIISDYAGIDALYGTNDTKVEAAINAGIDMVMVPQYYEKFIQTLTDLVNAGRVPLSRIDDAVRRILRVKMELGLFEQPFTDRSLISTVGSAEHRLAARECVRQSLVLLKNENNILPLKKSGLKIHVAGSHADNLGYQCGGWTITWQGAAGDITIGTTVLEAVQSLQGNGLTVSYSEDGSGAEDADVAVVVIGETPYAEWEGDRADLSLDPKDIEMIKKLKEANIPVVTVLITGRPMFIEDVLEYSDAVVAAWLPGTEGQGITDVLFGDYNPTGKLSQTWPRKTSVLPIQNTDVGYDPLFPYGFGLSFK